MRRLDVLPPTLADGDQHHDAQVADELSDLLVVGGRVRPELCHLPEHGDGAAPCRPIHEILERRAHRHRIRVPAVVHEQPAAGQRHLLAAPARERNDYFALDVDAERRRRVERAQRILCLVAPAKGEGDVAAGEAQPRGAVLRNRVRLPAPHDFEVASLHSKVVGHDRNAARRQRRDELALRLGNRCERANALQMCRSDVRDYTDGRAGDFRKRRDLSEAAHGELEDAHFGVELQPAERQRDAELVVVARLGRDRLSPQPGDGGKDVLRRRLPRGAGNRDHSRLASVAHSPAEGCQRGEGVFGHERRRGALSHRVADERLAATDGDEEITRGDAPGVDLHARRDGRSGRPLQAARAESLDLVELQRDHVRAASRRST